MWLDIKKWDKDFWIDLYKNEWLELFHQYEWNYDNISHEKLMNYCKIMSKNTPNINEEEKQLINYKLFLIMSLFTENHKYLWASLLIFRKKTKTDQVSLFT